MRAQIEARVVITGTTLNAVHLHFGAGKRSLRLFLFGGHRGIGQNVAVDPFRQPFLHVGAFLERADLVARNRFKIMREAADWEQIRQVCRQPFIGLRVSVYQAPSAGFVILQRVRADEGGKIGILAVQDRHHP